MARNDAAAKAEMKAAKQDLAAAHGRDRRSREQSDECGRANARVARAQEHVSWWRR